MTLMLFELKRNRLSLAVWTAAIALLLLVCLAIFPDMKGQVNELNTAFSSMGSFTEAFGMDQLNFGDSMGWSAAISLGSAAHSLPHTSA